MPRPGAWPCSWIITQVVCKSSVWGHDVPGLGQGSRVELADPVWHIEANARQAVTDLERLALKAMQRAADLLGQINREGAQADEARLLEWVTADDEAERLLHLSTELRHFFQATVARAWRLNRAVANGHTAFRAQAEFAIALLTELIAAKPVAVNLAETLLNLLEGVVRTSWAAETINSILRPYLTVKRSFQSRQTAQAWLNLFCLWFNMHPLKRSKRRHGDQPMSSYQYAGIKVYTDDGRETLDWLEAIGYSRVD